MQGRGSWLVCCPVAALRLFWKSAEKHSETTEEEPSPESQAPRHCREGACLTVLSAASNRQSSGVSATLKLLRITVRKLHPVLPFIPGSQRCKERHQNDEPAGRQGLEEHPG